MQSKIQGPSSNVFLLVLVLLINTSLEVFAFQAAKEPLVWKEDSNLLEDLSEDVAEVERITPAVLAAMDAQMEQAPVSWSKIMRVENVFHDLGFYLGQSLCIPPNKIPNCRTTLDVLYGPIFA